MNAGRSGFLTPLTRGAASGFRERGVWFSPLKESNPPLAFGSRPPCQGVKGKQRGFSYLGLLIAVAILGAGLAAFGEIASHAAQREKEAELLFRGNAFQQAIASYYRKDARYPQSLEQLLEDKRYPMPVRHLRKLYTDPMTGNPDWVLIEAPGGGFMGVHSRSEDAPIKTANFSIRYAGFENAARYADWKFLHQPPSPAGPKPAR
jgi:type II secretory pathway pseudopilin PulG